jgi:SET domain-containing protein
VVSRIVRRRSRIHGNGVFATALIRKGQKVTEYKGRVIPSSETKRLYDGDIHTGHTFLFALNDEWDVDANRRGNIARWINHGCDPNCITYARGHASRDPRRSRIIIEARRTIRPGDEILYDYCLSFNVPITRRLRELWACRCGSTKCRGTMLKPARTKSPARRARV